MVGFEHMQKGNAKKKKTENVFDVKESIRDGMVKYDLGDSRNTVVYGKKGQSIEELRRKCGVQ